MACSPAQESPSDAPWSATGYRARRRLAGSAPSSSITLLAPVIAPAIGAGILSFSDWRGVFWFVTGLGVVMFAAVWFGVPETLPVRGDERQWRRRDHPADGRPVR